MTRHSLTALTLVLALAAPAALAQAPKAKKKSGETPGQADRKAMAELATATPASDLKVAPGFKAELLYTVPKAEQGSWVALALDPKGRLLAGDQYGGLYRLTLPPLGSSEGTKVEKLDVKLPDVKPPAGGPEPKTQTQNKKMPAPRPTSARTACSTRSTASTSWSTRSPANKASGGCATPMATISSTKSNSSAR